MSEFKKISIGKSNKIDWLKDALEDYIERNPMTNEIRINNHFKLRIDLIANALSEMRLTNQLERLIIDGIPYYRIFKITDEDIREISLLIPFGNL